MEVRGGYTMAHDAGLAQLNANIAERLPKTDAKRLYCLDDADLRGLSVTYGRGMMGNCSENYLPSELLPVAEAKHGGAAGFLERRRKQQQRTRKKDLEEWKGKKASAQAAVARLAPKSSSGGDGAAASSSSAAASSSSSAPLAPVFRAPSAPAPASSGKGKAPATAHTTPTTAGDAAPKKSAFAVLMKSAHQT